jgi:hypothetical protein
MAQWHEHLPPPKYRLRHILAHDRVATRKPLLIPQPFENPMRRVPLLLVNLAVACKNGVDPRQIKPELLGCRPFTPTVSGRSQYMINTLFDEPSTVRITGRHRPDRGTIGRSSANRDYRMSRHVNASAGAIRT